MPAAVDPEAGGAPDLKEDRVFNTRQRLGMFGVLAVVAGTTLFFNMEEGIAEAKIWDSEIRRVQNATAVADQRNRRFILRNTTWADSEAKCAAVGAEICAPQRICRTQKKQGALNMVCSKKGNCNGKQRKNLKDRFVPAVDSGKHVWVRMRDCLTVEKPASAKLMTAVACCDKKDKKVTANFQPSIIKKAQRSGNNAINKKKKDADYWASHPVVDNMRASDPFMQSKMSGSKMKAFHQHVTDEAKEHLGVDLVNNTVTNKIMEHVSTISDTASRHYNNVVDKLSSSASSTIKGTSSALSGGSKPVGPPGGVSGQPRLSDPFQSGTIKPVHEIAAEKKPTAYGAQQSAGGAGGKSAKPAAVAVNPPKDAMMLGTPKATGWVGGKGGLPPKGPAPGGNRPTVGVALPPGK